MDKYVKIPLKIYEILLNKEYIVNSLLAISKCNETNQLEIDDLDFINEFLTMFKNNHEDFKKGEKNG